MTESIGSWGSPPPIQAGNQFQVRGVMEVLSRSPIGPVDNDLSTPPEQIVLWHQSDTTKGWDDGIGGLFSMRGLKSSPESRYEEISNLLLEQPRSVPLDIYRNEAYSSSKHQQHTRYQVSTTNPFSHHKAHFNNSKTGNPLNMEVLPFLSEAKSQSFWACHPYQSWLHKSSLRNPRETSTLQDRWPLEQKSSLSSKNRIRL